MLNTQLINGLMINWDKISPDSYLRRIDAIHNVEHIAFTHPVTFFVGENGSGKSTLLEAIAIAYGFNPEVRREARGTITFPLMTPIPNSAGRSVFPEAYATQNMDISCARRAFTMWRQKRKNTAEGRAAGRSIFMRSHMVKASWLWHRTVSVRTDCTCWTSRKRLFPRSVS